MRAFNIFISTISEMRENRMKVLSHTLRPLPPSLPPSLSPSLPWSAVGFAAVRVSARAAAMHSTLCPAFHALVWQQQRERVRVGEAERR